MLSPAQTLTRSDRGRFTLIHGDAADYELPPGSVLLYLFHPFDSEVTAKVASAAMRSWNRDKRMIRVAYLNPEHSAKWVRAGWHARDSVAGCVIFAPDMG